MELHDAPAAGKAMQTIHILSDQEELVKVILYLDQGMVRCIRLTRPDQASSPVVPLPHQPGISPKGPWRSQIFGAVLVP
jgi:hypothetical protein